MTIQRPRRGGTNRPRLRLSAEALSLRFAWFIQWKSSSKCPRHLRHLLKTQMRQGRKKGDKVVGGTPGFTQPRRSPSVKTPLGWHAVGRSRSQFWFKKKGSRNETWSRIFKVAARARWKLMVHWSEGEHLPTRLKPHLETAWTRRPAVWRTARGHNDPFKPLDSASEQDTEASENDSHRKASWSD